MVGIIFISYAGKYAAKLFLRSKISSITFGIIPIVYYFFDYITTTYTNLLYSGNPVASEFMPFVCCIGYLTFIIFYLKEYELKCDAERREQMIHFQYEHTASQIDAIRHSEYEMQILRHDLRHMLTNLATLMDNYDLEKSREYLNKMLDKVSSIRVHRYCENELINAVLSFYNHKCSETGNISLHIDVKIPKDLSCNDMEFSFILSNGLENAYNAASKNDSKSTISVKILVDEMNHLLLTIKNPFKEKPSFVNNLPTTSAPGHGIGSQSIKYLTEKMGGRCQFTAENNLFVLRVII
ncbi:sensor histidine kinase [Clostridium isatidis]|uniref:Sensor histidine kinase NatK-like C-terminal domain-containing protein n=1 Tax=Clostridium isatidis TaxID=182773 RepID=A0A343JDY1_9CLOT|nr:GHKL domain-containing protein [Clostridium isatidis]ASW43739.1 hypothetical protein BEN51_09665 [Clostridium isatidis]